MAAPAGDTLGLGAYTNVIQPRENGQPWIGLVHGGSTCGNAYGRFEILGLTVDGGGDVTSLALTIEYACNQPDGPATFVDLQFASTVPLAALTTDTTSLDFGTQVTGRPSPATTIDLAAAGSSSSTISSISFSGPDATDFSVSTDSCSGSTLDPGATCQFSVRMTASGIGPRQATLAIADDGYPGVHSIEVAGVGTAFSIVPATLDFGYPVVFTKTSKTITLTNGNQSRSLGGFVVTSVSRDITSSAKEFTLRTSTGCLALPMIPALASCDVTIDYEPVTAAGATGTVTWLVAGTPIDAIQLSGYATPTSAVTWTNPPSYLKGGAWTSGNSLARSTRGTLEYLHAGASADYVKNRWATDRGPYVGVYYRRSTNGGRNWAASVRINPANKHGARASVAASGKYVYVTWVSQTKWVHYSRKAPRVLYLRVNAKYGAGAWGVSHRLTPLAGRVDYPVVAASGATVYVVYTDAKAGKVRIAISRNHGKTWASSTLGVTTQLTSDGRAGFPNVAVTGLTVVVTWTADAAGTTLAKVSTDAGRSWTGSTMTTNATSSADAAATDGRLSVVWATDDGTQIRTWKDGA